MEPLLVARRPLSYLFDVRIGFGLFAFDVRGFGLGDHELVPERRDLPSEPLDLGKLWQRAAAVRDQIQSGVELLELEQSKLGLWVGVQLGRLDCTCMVHGSVGVCETRVSIVVPKSRSACSNR